MKSLQTLILSHILVSIFVTFFLLSGHIEHPFLIIFLLFLPVLNKGQRFQKIQSKKYIFQNGARRSLVATMAGLSVMFLLFSCGLLNF